MKNTLNTMLVVGSLSMVSLNALAHDSSKTFKFAGDTKFAGFCKAVVLDDVKILRANLSRQVGVLARNQREALKLVTESEELKCNGKSLVDFSKSREAKEVHAFLTASVR